LAAGSTADAPAKASSLAGDHIALLGLGLAGWLGLSTKRVNSLFRRLPRSSAGILLAFSLLLVPPQAGAQIKARFVTPRAANEARPEGARMARQATPAPACQRSGGELDTISVPVNGSTSVSIQLYASLPYDLDFHLTSSNYSYVVFGDETAGFGPTVTIPAGETFSPPFTIEGVAVGTAYVIATSSYTNLEDPVTVWNVNNLSGTALQLLDENNLTTATTAYPSCVSPAGNVTTSPTILATCGIPIKGVATDGVSPVLLRTVAASSGTACFTLTSTGSLAYGNVATPSMETAGVGGLYYAFSQYTPPDGYGDTTDSRTVNIQFDFTLDSATGFTNTTSLTVPTTLVRPPVVLLHGVWSSSGIWNSAFYREQPGYIYGSAKGDSYTTYAADYSKTAGGPFTTNQLLVQGFIAEALKRIRTKPGNYAAAQADVIGHSMGGDLTRLYSTLTTGPSAYKRPDNLNLGDVHRLITLDTPHLGSNFPNLIIAMNNYAAGALADAIKETVKGLTKGDITQGAVCDLAQNSTGLMALNSPTNLTGQYITGSAGPPPLTLPNGPALYWGGITVAGHTEGDFESTLTARQCVGCAGYVYPQNVVTGWRFREPNDSIVPLSSQQGNNPTSAQYNFPNDLHQHIPAASWLGAQGVTDDPNVALQAFALLDGPVSALVNPLPAVNSAGNGVAISPTLGLGSTADQTNYTAQCTSGGPLYPAPPASSALTPADEGSAAPRSAPVARRPHGAATVPASSIIVTAPATGAMFGNSDTISITVSVAAGITVTGYGASVSGAGLFPGTGLSTGAGGSTFQVSVPLNAYSVGPVTITPYIFDGTGAYDPGTPATVVEQYTGAPLASVQLSDHNFLTLLPGATQALFLMGTYSDGAGPFDISSSLMGTTWSSSNTSVLTVDQSGNVTIAAVGTAVVTAQNGTLSDWATFVVEDPATPLAPIDYTSQFAIQATGLRLDRNTGFYVQTVTLTNTSDLPLTGPLYLVVSGLPAQVSLAGIDGVTANIAPVGSGYFTLPLAGYGLTTTPGQVMNLEFQFLDPNEVELSYSLQIVRTSVAP
jgi:pimeloyl-ACP methyl ester carboxylesterase